MGCDFGQGALIAPPMPQECFLDLLRQRVNKPRPPAPAAGRPPQTRSAAWPEIGRWRGGRRLESVGLHLRP